MSRICRIGALAVLMVCLMAAGARAAVITINYDGTGFSNPTQILGHYAVLAGSPVHSAGFMWLDYGGSIDSTYGPHSVTAMAFAQYDNPVWVSWSVPVQGIEFWYGYSYPLSVRGYLTGVEVFNSGPLPANSGGMFLYDAPDVAIDRLVFDGTANYWTMDDLSYSTDGAPPVPEPGSMLLLGTGLVGLGRAWRRRRA